MRGSHADTMPSVASKDEELCYVPDLSGTRDLRSLLHQDKTGEIAIRSQ